MATDGNARKTHTDTLSLQCIFLSRETLAKLERLQLRHLVVPHDDRAIQRSGISHNAGHVNPDAIAICQEGGNLSAVDD